MRRSLACYWRHSGWASDPVARAFDPAAFDRIERVVSEGEAGHRGEIRFALEQSLDWGQLRRGVSARERALQVFGEHRVWDTEYNTGVLIYLLTADHAVEIIADRHAHQHLPAGLWPQLCRMIVDACRDGRPVDGVIVAIERLNQAFIDALPVLPGADNRNELDNRPVRL
ncbi:MAG: TPM domain-containing protein [Lautropia sp.]|nr:TPM domain-containing protein [Lautropia sp.]